MKKLDDLKSKDSKKEKASADMQPTFYYPFNHFKYNCKFEVKIVGLFRV